MEFVHDVHECCRMYTNSAIRWWCCGRIYDRLGISALAAHGPAATFVLLLVLVTLRLTRGLA